MPHVILAFYVFALMLAAASLSQTWTMWQRYRKVVIRRFGFFQAALTLILASFAIDLYAQVARVDHTSAAAAVYWITSAAGCLLFIFCAPGFYHALIGLVLRRWMLVAYFAVDVAACVLALIYLVAPRIGATSIALNALVFAMVIFGLILLAVNLHSVADRALARAMRVFGALTVVFLPLMFVDAAMSYIPALRFFRFLNGLAQPAYFLVLNALSLVFGQKYLNRPAYEVDGKLSDYFISTFGITEREQDVITVLLDGAAAKDIAEKLFISPKTADNHLYRIYRKLGVRNRLQLFRLVRGNS